MTLLRILSDVLVAGIATAGFAVMFVAPRRALFAGALIGGVGYLVYDLIVLMTAQPAAAAFVAGALIGFAAEITARMGKMPTTVYATMGVIPLVPGYGLYQTMLYMVQGDYALVLSSGMETIMVAGAIAMGLGLATVLARKALSGWRKKAV